MNIAMVSEHASPLATLGGIDAGGQNVHVAALAGALVKLRHTVTVYTRRDSRILPRRVTMASGVIVEHVDAAPPRPIAKDDIYRYVPTFAAQLRRSWDIQRPDIVHSHFWMSGLAALNAARPLALPVVHTYHALGIEKQRHQGAADTSPPRRIDEEARIARESDRIIATASAEVFELMRMGAEQRTLRLIPCGVDVGAFTPVGPRDPRRSGRLRIVTLSRLVPRKGVDTVVEALARIPDTELIIAGGGESPDLIGDPEANRLTAIAKSCRVADRVFMIGRVSRQEVPSLLRSADIVVCAPWYEPFGIVPLEAMACGIPVIVTSVGGLIDTVVDGVTGLHIAPRSPDQLAQAVNALRRDSARRQRMGKAGADRVRARYSWSRIAAETAEVYGTVITGARTGELATGS